MLLSLSLVAALAAAPAAPAAPADSISGAWKITGDVMGNPIDQTCTMQLTGAKLAGTCTGAQGEKLELTGDVKDGKIIFRHGADYQGQALTVTYTGTLAAPKQLKGTIDVAPMGVNGVFTAVPAPTKP